MVGSCNQATVEASRSGIVVVSENKKIWLTSWDDKGRGHLFRISMRNVDLGMFVDSNPDYLGGGFLVMTNVLSRETIQMLRDACDKALGDK